MVKRAIAGRGEGRPYKRKQDGRWVVAVHAPDQDGVVRRRYLYGSSRDEVIAKRDELRTAIAGGLQRPDTKLTVGRHLDGWLASKRETVRPSTWISYEGHVRMHLSTIRNIPLIRLAPNDVRKLRSRLLADGLATRTVGYSLTVLRMALGQAVADGLVPRNVASTKIVEPPKVVRAEMAFLSALEVRRLVAAAEKAETGPLWTLLVGTGMRLGEALALRWSDLDLEAAELHVRRSLRPIDRRMRTEGEPRLQAVEPKTDQSRRTISLARFVVKALRRQETLVEDRPRNVAGYVFTTPRGTPLDPRNVSRDWVDFTAAAALPTVRIHDLRHTAASLMLAQGFTLEDVKRILGHATIAQTSDTYGHLVRERQRELARAMDTAVGGR